MTYRAVRLRKRSWRRGIGYGAAISRAIGGKHRAEGWPIRGQGICAHYKEDRAVGVVFEGEDVYSSLAKDFTNFLNRELVKHPFLRRDIVPRQHVCSLVHFTQHMCRLQWAQIVLGPHKKVDRQRAESIRDEATLVIYVWHHGPAVWAY